jgi:FtsP/CotA-like multicopper oxidase with cupredoxin domain
MTMHTDPSPGSFPSAPPPRRLRRLLPALAPVAALTVLAAAAVLGLTGAPGLSASGGSGGFDGLVEYDPRDTVTSPILTEPDTFVSVNRVLNVTLEVVMDSIVVPTGPGTGGKQLLRAWRVTRYNGQPVNGRPSFPGPTFIVSPGDSVAIVLQNRLPRGTSNEACMAYAAANTGIDKFEDCFHGPNWTNIHYHGFHVTPDSMGDDVLLQIPPGRDYTYGFRIPHNQSPGTHWYHPHKHGSVALQVGNGMSGAFIVRGGGLDSLTRSLRMKEHLIAVQRVDSQLNLIDGAFAGTQLVNGQFTPTIVMRRGEVQRWRIVNEAITKTQNFQIGFSRVSGGASPTVWDVARDGVQFAPANYSVTRPDPTLLLAPGNRMDVFVRAPTQVGLHLLGARSVVNSGARVPRNQLVTAAAVKPLFYVRVIDDNAPVNRTLPTRLPDLPRFLQNLPGPLDPGRIDTSRTPMVVFIDSFPPNRDTLPVAQFWLGNAVNPFQRYASNSVFIPTTSRGQQLPMVLDSLQTWVVKNMGTSTNHPFHIHINPFQVVHVHYPRGSKDPNAQWYADMNAASHTRRSPIWLDVVPLPLPDTLNPRGNPGYVIIRQRYDNFQNADGSNCANCGDPTGWFVIHCHILGHEERGMMQVVQIVHPGQRPTPPPPGAASGHAAAGGHRH